MLYMIAPNKSNENSEETILAADIQGPAHLVPCYRAVVNSKGFILHFGNVFHMERFKHMQY